MNANATPLSDGPGAPRSAVPTHMATIRRIPAGSLGGPMAIVEHVLPAGLPAPPPQLHTRDDVWAIVLEGTLGARIGDEYTEAGAGDYIVKRRGLMHTFWNAGDTPVRFVELVIPAQ